MVHDPQHASEEELDQAAEQPEPTHSQTRQRFSSPPPEARRTSARPSAFGPPRTSRPPVAPRPSGAPTLGPDSTPPTDPGRARPAPLPDLPSVTPATTTGGFRANVEELLPLPDASQSLPRIPIAAVLPPPEAQTPQAGRSLPRVAAFALVIAASAIPVLRYTGTLSEPVADEAPPVAAASVVAAPKPAVVAPVAAATPVVTPRTTPFAPREAPDPIAQAVARIQATLPEDAREAAEALVDEAERATSASELHLAEALLGKALKLDDKNPHAAFALARVRLAQGNLEGAEGWALAALEYRPKRAEYHAFYADVLERLERHGEARRERERARELSRR